MRKSLFKKYLRITTFIIAMCFVFLIVVMITLISRQWRDEKREVLGKNASAIATLASNNTTYDAGNDVYVVNELVMLPFIEAFARNSDSDIFITNVSGECLLGEFQKSGKETLGPVPQEVVAIAMQGQYVAQGTLGGAYDRPYYVVGVPVTVSDEDGFQTTIGIVFSSTSVDALATYWVETLHMIFWVGITIFMVAFCVVWIFSYKLVQPLRQMTAAAHSFGEGDFSARISVSSEDEIGQLASALNNMATSLSSSENMRRNFIANVSHELKTPMTTIAGFIDGILDGTIPKEQEPKYLSIVSQEVKRLSRLVRTMLDLSRIDSGELKIRPGRFDLTQTVFSTLITFEQSIEEKQLEIRGLETAESLFVDGDPDMIHQVVYNLVENAVKFTNQGGYIEITIFDGPARSGVRIRNSGAGIAPEEIGMIFDRFYKTDKSRSQDKNGMGLGLYIVKTIIRLHGGEITARSEPGSYTEFEFWLPKKQEPPKLKDGALPSPATEGEESHRKASKKDAAERRGKDNEI